MSKPRKAVHHKPCLKLVDGKFVDYVQDRDVRILAVAEGWAMVRIKGGSTYAAPMKEIDEKQP